MTISTLLTSNGLELPCVVLPVQRQLFPLGKEVIVYCQNRLVRGIILDEDDCVEDSLVSEIEIIVDWCIIPDLQEMLYGLQSNGVL